MRRAVAPDPPAARLDRTLLSAQALALLVVLGTGTPSAAMQASAEDPLVPEESLPASAPAPVPPAMVEEGPEPYVEAQPGATVEGYLSLRWLSRWTEDSGDDDHDLYGVVGVDVDSGGKDSWGFHLLGRGAWSVTPQDPDSVFYNVQDSYGSDLSGQLYHAYFDLPLQEELAVARLGRILIYDTPESAHFDGAQIESKPVGPTQVNIGAYGGASVHLFEAWPSNEWLAGLYTSFRPWERGKIRVDWMHFEDDVRVGTGNNDLVTVDVEHRPIDEVRLEGQYSMLDGRNRDMRLKGFLLMPDENLTLRLSYYRLLEPQVNFAYELNPFYNFLNVYQPYDQGQVVLTKTFSETLDVMAGFDIRRVEQQEDIGQFNRDFDRYYLTMALLDLLPLSTTLSVTGEVWDSPNNDTSAWGIDLTSRFREDSRVAIGSFYSLYKYQWDVNTEREDVRTYFGEYRYKLSAAASLKFRYEYENAPTDVFHSVRMGLAWQF